MYLYQMIKRWNWKIIVWFSIVDKIIKGRKNLQHRLKCQ